MRLRCGKLQCETRIATDKSFTYSKFIQDTGIEPGQYSIRYAAGPTLCSAIPQYSPLLDSPTDYSYVEDGTWCAEGKACLSQECVVMENLPQDQQEFCGDQVVNQDGAEECDCGHESSCDDACCDATTCQLKEGAKCSSSDPCCDANCELANTTQICRASEAECDLAEYCSGDSSQCPEDAFKQAGQSCNGTATTGHCYNGQCFTVFDQCLRRVW